MNDIQIDYFLAVATNLSFTKTSAELYVSQPAISKQIALMEEELGVRLFNRNNKKTSLTEAGEMYYDFFKKHRAQLANLQKAALRTQSRNTYNVRIGFIEGWDLISITKPLCEAFKEKYPRSSICFDCCGIKDLTNMLSSGRLDFIVTLKSALVDLDNIESRPIREIRKILLMSDDHPLASKENLTIEDFRDEKFFAPWGAAEKEVTKIINSYITPHGYTPNIEFVHNNESMIACVRNNLGVALSDEWSFFLNLEGLSHIKLPDREQICVAWRKENKSTLVDEIIKALEKRIKNKLSIDEL